MTFLGLYVDKIGTFKPGYVDKIGTFNHYMWTKLGLIMTTIKPLS